MHHQIKFLLFVLYRMHLPCGSYISVHSVWNITLARHSRQLKFRVCSHRSNIRLNKAGVGHKWKEIAAAAQVPALLVFTWWTISFCILKLLLHTQEPSALNYTCIDTRTISFGIVELLSTKPCKNHKKNTLFLGINTNSLCAYHWSRLVEWEGGQQRAWEMN